MSPEPKLANSLALFVKSPVQSPDFSPDNGKISAYGSRL
ncbi:hypothetical protein FLM9_327 [Candidatus Synechococcus spongiarum]|uniref:Uncharacterized protein n=1 Tax=Candidatus Synechococcus spongiarum TaxID=431041 RepID=A0A165AEV1_9SYNE|nr:hypothetical protein FLM9_327 [Candidatus Synechococcus spongiarum]